MAANVSAPLTGEPFEFEKLVGREVFNWMEINWKQSVCYSIVYIFVIFSLKRFMNNHKAFDLKKPLILWNLSFAIFSTAASVRLVPRLFQAWKTHDPAYPICAKDFTLCSPPAVFWCSLFVMSKPMEFGDTLFIVLRKKNLVFLHWYHHTMTLIMTWYLTSNLASISYFFTTMNYFVHSLMYTYFTLTALDFRPPRFIAMLITTFQIFQMVTGLLISLWALMRTLKGAHYCESPLDTVVLSLFVYFSYFVLFSRLFYNNYIVKLRRVKYLKSE